MLRRLARLAADGPDHDTAALLARDDEAAVVARALLDYHESRRRLEAEEIRHRRIVESSLDPVVTVDGRGHVIEFNPAAERAFGVHRESVVGRAVATVIEPDQLRTAQRRSFQKFLAAGAPTERGHRVEAVGRRPDGSSFPIEMAVTVLQETAGPVFCASIKDLSDRSEVAIAKRESEAKSRFLAAMSHELRTPLNSILGFTQLLETETFGELNERQRRYLGHIQASGSHLLRLINEVLDLAKVQAGHLSVAAEEVAVETIVAEVAGQIEPLALSKGVHLVVNAPLGTTAVGDRHRIRQILFNLVSNAIKFTPADGSIFIRAALGADCALIEVADTGVGIAEDQLARVFDEFVQLDQGAASRLDGTGLGLALSRRLANLMGGRLTVASAPGRGSTFTLRLPHTFVSRPVPALHVAGMPPADLAG